MKRNFSIFILMVHIYCLHDLFKFIGAGGWCIVVFVCHVARCRGDSCTSGVRIDTATHSVPRHWHRED